MSSHNSGTLGDADIADDSRTEDWLAYGRTHSEQRYSPLDDVNRETVHDLGVAWSWISLTMSGWRTVSADRKSVVGTYRTESGTGFFIESKYTITRIP